MALRIFPRNALSTEMLQELKTIFEAVNGSKDARCVLLTASEGKVFSAGHNLKELVFCKYFP